MKKSINKGWVIINTGHPRTGNKYIVSGTFSRKRTDSISLFIKGSGSNFRYWKEKFNFKCVRAESIIELNLNIKERMKEIKRIKDQLEKIEINEKVSLDQILYLYNNGVNFIHELIKKEEILKSKLSENLDLYKKKNLMNGYDKTFSQWNKCNLVLWDLKDILSRMGGDLD
jgi:hypothetical protein